MHAHQEHVAHVTGNRCGAISGSTNENEPPQFSIQVFISPECILQFGRIYSSQANIENLIQDIEPKWSPF
jgi:hypothetical protein